MSEFDDLPEYYQTDDRRRVQLPTYEALAQCQIIMASETGHTGPTLVEPGEHFTTDAMPNHQWMPLNRAAGDRYEAWLAALPNSGAGLTQAEITEAAFAMRPREGEPEVAHDQWWPAVLKYASALKDKRQGGSLRVPAPAMPQRVGGKPMPVMPFSQSGSAMPTDPGRPPAPDGPVRQAADNAPRRARPQPQRPAMANAPASDAPGSTAT